MFERGEWVSRAHTEHEGPCDVNIARIATISPILVNNHCQTLEYTRRECDLGGLRKDLGLTTPLHSQVTVPQTHTSKESSRRALTRGIGGGGVVERFGGVLGDMPRGPKN